MQKDLKDAIVEVSRSYGFRPRYLIAIALRENSGRWAGTRHEPAYRWLWDVTNNRPFTLSRSRKQVLPRGFTGLPGVTTAAEEFDGQMTSWGPMQVMGAVAREYGFRGRFQELQGRTGVEYGVRHFVLLYRRLYRRFGIAGVVSAYNDGDPNPRNNAEYVFAVMDAAKAYKE